MLTILKAKEALEEALSETILEKLDPNDCTIFELVVNRETGHRSFLKRYFILKVLFRSKIFLN